MKPRSRILAEHEAAHAVVARHFGLPVVEIVLGRSSGHTLVDFGPAELWQRAVVTAAGDLFNKEQGTVPYEDYGCGDLRDFERDHGLSQLWDAQRAARSVLKQRREAVVRLADQLMRTPLLRYDEHGQLRR
ncbi:hypothetical protein ACGFMM_11175 [Streptomyces sp. NPDC048604]|uniref:hypothetical protein n=1 Tax=Streptomyces sp. NPDC048604 TaxID=3365578 RepID=UPI00371C8E20